MGRTLTSITQTWTEEEAALKRFGRALRREDQQLLDELMVLSRLHLAESSYASNLYPLDMYLISMIIEFYKQFKALVRELKPEASPIAEIAEHQEQFLRMIQAAGKMQEEAEAALAKSAPPKAEVITPIPGMPQANLSYAPFEDAP